MSDDTRMIVRERSVFVKHYGAFIMTVAIVFAIITPFVAKKVIIKPDLYTARVQFIVKTMSKNETLTKSKQLVELDESIRFTIMDLVKSDKVLADSIKSVYGNNYYSTKQLYTGAVNNLKGNMLVEMNEGSSMISYTVTQESEKTATRLANSIARNVKEMQKEYWQRKSINVVSKAFAAEKKYTSSIKKLAFIGFWIGILVGLPISVVWDANKNYK